MKSRIFCLGLLAIVAIFVVSCEQEKERAYIGLSPSNDQLKILSSETIKKVIKPNGAMGEVPTWLNVDLLSDKDTHVLYSGTVERMAYTNGLHSQISSKLTTVPATEQAFVEALTRIQFSLDQTKDNSKLRVFIVTKGLSSSSAKIDGILKSIAEKKERLSFLCILGVDEDKRISTSSIFEPIRSKVLVTSTLKAEQKNCFAH